MESLRSAKPFISTIDFTINFEVLITKGNYLGSVPMTTTATATVIVPICVGHPAFACYLANLAYCLRSLQVQTVPFEFLVADYGSIDPYGEQVKSLTNKYGAKYIRGEGTIWSRSRALNLGITNATKFRTLFVDSDCVVPPEYVAQHMAAGTSNKIFTYSPVYDTDADVVRTTDTTILAKHSVGIRPEGFSHMGVPTAWLKKHNGFNEAYVGWGGEDNDLWLRLRRSGVSQLEVPSHPYNLWHPFYGDIMASIGKGDMFKKIRQDNRNRYFNFRDAK